MALKFLTACGSGLGSSLMISMNISKVIKELGLDAEVEHCDISSLSTKSADYYVFAKDVAESAAVSGINPEKIIVLENLLSIPELKQKISEKL